MNRYLIKARKIYKSEGLVSLIIKAASFFKDSSFHRPLISEKCIMNDVEVKNLSETSINLNTPEKIDIKFRKGSEERAPEFLKKISGKRLTTDVNIFKLSDINLLGLGVDNPTIAKKGNKFFYPVNFGNTLGHKPKFEIQLKDLFLDPNRDKKSIDEGFIIDFQRRSGFPKWFYEQIPKLYWYEKYCEKTKSRPLILFSATLSDWQRKAVELMGYSESEYVEIQEGQIIELKSLLLPPHPLRTLGDHSYLIPSAFKHIRETVSKNLNPQKKFSNKIYVSRADGSHRKVINEEEVIRFLKKYGFESFELSRHSLEEQIEIFSHAEFIIGVHGAGLTNMIHSKKSRVLELLTKYTGEHFFSLANECNHDYDYLICCMSKGDKEKRYRDMKVDLNELEKKINQSTV